MAGINLSQGVEKSGTRRRVSLDTGFIFAVIITVVVLGAWGVVRYFLYTTDKEIGALDTAINEANTSLRGEKVDRVLAFDLRRQNIEQGFESHVDVEKNLQQVEDLILPNVRLTAYDYDHSTGNTTIAGLTTEYKYLAQQLISLKKESRFSTIRVHSLSNTESGEISFVMKSETLSQ